MQILVTSRHFQAPVYVREYAEEKVNKILRYIKKPVVCSVILSQENNIFIAEMKLTVKRKQIFVKGKSDDINKSIDIAYDKLVVRVKKFNELRQVH